MNAKLCKKLRKLAELNTSKPYALVRNENGSLVNIKGSFREMYRSLKLANK